jgi:signal transduction histidine kinase/ActR/RegA family two-component response regulator
MFRSARQRGELFARIGFAVFAAHWLLGRLGGNPFADVHLVAAVLVVLGTLVAQRFEAWRAHAGCTAMLLLTAMVITGVGDGRGAAWMGWLSSPFLGVAITRSVREGLPYAGAGAVATVALEWVVHGGAHPEMLMASVLWFALLTGSIAEFSRAKNTLNQSLAEALERASAAERARAEFLTTMSHEIRTPLHGILGIAQLLADADVGAQHRKLVSTLHSSSEVLLGLLNDVLDLSKLEAGELELHPAPVRIRELLERLVDAGRGAVAGRAVDVVLQVRPEVPAWVEVDANRLGQIVGNLLGNAAKYTDAGEIRVTVGWVARSLTLLVTDTGSGIDPAMLPMLFDRFSQGEEGTQRGTGLGLALVRELVQRMGGDVDVDSRVGVGTTFALTVVAPRAAPLAEVDREHSLVGVRLLLVDDHPVNCMVGRRLLESRGAEVTVAESGALAIALVRGGLRPDLTLMDAHMPELDGFETARVLLGDPVLAHPIVLLSAGGPAEAAAAEAVGMVGFLPKPMELESACAVIVREARPRNRAPDVSNAPATEEAALVEVG